MRNLFSSIGWLGLFLTSWMGIVPLNAQAGVDRIEVIKSTREMKLYDGDTVLRRYTISLGGAPVGAKAQEGDRRTPEGDYVISGRNPKSSFHLSLRISYPDAEDRIRAVKLGVPPGGDIMIHGLRNGLGWLGSAHRVLDWTNGCIAVTNAEIEEIWRLVPDGTPITILP